MSSLAAGVLVLARRPSIMQLVGMESRLPLTYDSMYFSVAVTIMLRSSVKIAEVCMYSIKTSFPKFVIAYRAL